MNQNTELIQGGSIMELPVLEIKNVHKKYLSHTVLEGVGFPFQEERLLVCWDQTDVEKPPS